MTAGWDPIRLDTARLRETLRQRCLSIRSAAEWASIPESTLRRLVKRDGSSAAPRTLAAIATALGVSERWLAGGEP